ncbi:WD40-repeat-containing domain protein [Umbelopsis sp. AD052]|nr:WD40-repeat-containing domain protein [Umbelopsis sp. AD052]
MPPSQTSACHVRFDDHLLSPMASSISFPEYPTHKPLKSALRRSSVQLSTSPRSNGFPTNDSRISLSSSLDSSKAPKSNSSRKTVKTKSKNKKKDFQAFYLNQTLSDPLNGLLDVTADPVLNMRFSQDGSYLATASKGGIIRIWQLSPDSYTLDELFVTKPIQEFTSHKAAVLDLSWSKNNFLLSSSMDKTVRLWHVERSECLCIFQHYDIVTCVEFHPKDDRFFLSGSIDAKLRIWNIPGQRVHVWNKISDTHMITAAGFTKDGTKVCAGSAMGAFFVYSATTLELEHEITLGTDRKVTGIEHSPTHPSMVLVSSNDSMIRLVNCDNQKSICNFKGSVNTKMQISASFSDDGKYVVCGSEDRRVYIWKTMAEFYHQESTDDSVTDTETSSVKTDATEPMTKKQLKEIAKRQKEIAKQEKKAEKARKKEEKQLIKKLAKNEPESFEAHKDTVISAVMAPMKTRQLLAVDGVVMITADETGCIRIWTCTSTSDSDQSSSSEKSS